MIGTPGNVDDVVVGRAARWLEVGSRIWRPSLVSHALNAVPTSRAAPTTVTTKLGRCTCWSVLVGFARRSAPRPHRYPGPVDERLCLLTVHAHPDDEASKGAPTLARYHAEGMHTVLVCCTGGEEGDLQNPSMRAEGGPLFGMTPEEEKAAVGARRAEELAASAEAIGFDEVVMLGYRDSGMPDSPPNEHPESFHQADIDEAAGRLVAVIRRTRPQVIITYGDDQRSTRIPTTSRCTTSPCWPSSGPPIPTGIRRRGSPSSR